MSQMTRSLGTSVGEVPSVFEVLATESLSNGLKNGLKHLSRILAQSYPVRFSVLIRSFEEFYCLAEFVVQFYHLKRHNASFAENFYGLKRVDQSGQSTTSLSGKRLYASLVVLALFPYLSDWIQRRYRKLKEESQRSTLEMAFLKCFPHVYLAGNTLSFLYYLFYTVGQSSVHSPWLHLAGCRLRPLNDQDLVQIQEQEQINSSSIVQRAVSGMVNALSMGAFFLQFLEWWYAQEGTHQSLGALPVPQPPRNMGTTQPGLCPLCQQTIRNHTVLAVSGYVFCYRCIHQSLSLNPCCPVTKYPADHSQLVKIYPPTD